MRPIISSLVVVEGHRLIRYLGYLGFFVKMIAILEVGIKTCPQLIHRALQIFIGLIIFSSEAMLYFFAHTSPGGV